MEYISLFIPIFIAGLVGRIITKIAKFKSNKLILTMILAVALTEMFLPDWFGGVELSFGYGFMGALAYNMLKVRTFDEENKTPGEVEETDGTEDEKYEKEQTYNFRRL